MGSGELALGRHLGFASDARAALLIGLQTVGLQTVDMLVVAGAALAGYGARYGSLGVQPPYWAYIVIGCVMFGLVMQRAGMYRFAALRRRREHLFLVAVLPLLGLIAALIKLDSPGPVLFRQQRFGFNKQPFTFYKFRSMHAQAGDDPSVPQATRDDPRVTRVGRVLRRTSLDELPQFLKVLKGDMSLVGPRPHSTPLDDRYAALIDGYLARHHVKPGITGWAQVNGLRGETDTLQKMERRVAYDLRYINKWSPLLDLRILCKTLVVFLGQRNAY